VIRTSRSAATRCVDEAIGFLFAVSATSALQQACIHGTELWTPMQPMLKESAQLNSLSSSQSLTHTVDAECVRPEAVMQHGCELYGCRRPRYHLNNETQGSVLSM
jgi:hypothetical protein